MVQDKKNPFYLDAREMSPSEYIQSLVLVGEDGEPVSWEDSDESYLKEKHSHTTSGDTKEDDEVVEKLEKSDDLKMLSAKAIIENHSKKFSS